MDLSLGQSWANRYKIERMLGKGGMGSVYLASDSVLDNEAVALKILHHSLTEDEQSQKRFISEVRLTRKVTHPAVVRTFEVGRFQDVFFFTMEYVEGASLKDLISSHPMPFNELVHLVVQIAEGLQAIHDAGIVHRDLKPSNVIVSSGSRAKISDFGVAHSITTDGGVQTEVVGSLGYIAPEVWRGEKAKIASDIYALGIMCYEMASGSLPFDGNSPAEVMCKHLEATAIPLYDLVPGIPLWFSGFVMDLISRSPQGRPQSAGEIVQILKENISPETLRIPSAPQYRPRPSLDDSGDFLAIQSEPIDTSQLLSSIPGSSLLDSPQEQRVISSLLELENVPVSTELISSILDEPISQRPNALEKISRRTDYEYESSLGRIFTGFGIFLVVCGLTSLMTYFVGRHLPSTGFGGSLQRVFPMFEISSLVAACIFCISYIGNSMRRSAITAGMSLFFVGCIGAFLVGTNSMIAASDLSVGSEVVLREHIQDAVNHSVKTFGQLVIMEKSIQTFKIQHDGPEPSPRGRSVAFPISSERVAYVLRLLLCFAYCWAIRKAVWGRRSMSDVNQLLIDAGLGSVIAFPATFLIAAARSSLNTPDLYLFTVGSMSLEVGMLQMMGVFVIWLLLIAFYKLTGSLNG